MTKMSEALGEVVNIMKTVINVDVAVDAGYRYYVVGVNSRVDFAFNLSAAQYIKSHRNYMTDESVIVSMVNDAIFGY